MASNADADVGTRRTDDRGVTRLAAPLASDRDGMFRLLVESVRDYAIFMLDPDGRVASWNAGAASIKGYAREEILGKHFSVFYPPEAIERGVPRYELEVASACGRFEDEGWRLRKDGSAFWANVVIAAMRDEHQRLCGFAKVTRDLTARRQLEVLQQNERRMNEFLAMLAHELRNPLSPIQSALDVAARKPDDAQTWQWARQIIERQTLQLKRLVDDLLDVSRITRGKITLQLETVDLRTIVEQVVESWHATATARRQTLEATLPDEPTLVRVDSVRLAQVLSNLVGNAVKYTQESGRITVVVRPGNGVVWTTIADNGIGIAADLVPRVFEIFVQGERGLDRAEGGLGVGLTLAKRLVDILGGSLTAASEGPGRGSRFTLALPTALPLEPSSMSSPITRGARPRKIMVVDDSRDAADSLAALLEVLGHRTVVLHDGADVVSIAAAQRPDFILLDIGLPGLDGFEIARRLRSFPDLAGVRLIACTGYGRDEDAQRIVEAGFNGHLVKPVTAADLERALAV